MAEGGTASLRARRAARDAPRGATAHEAVPGLESAPSAGTPAPSSAEASWVRWRSRAVGVILGAVALANLPALFGVLFHEHLAAPLWLKLTYVGLEVGLVFAALAWRRSYRVRTLVWVAATFAIAIIGLTRVGMAGSGRVFLLAIGPFVLILLGRRLGLLIAGLTAAVLAAFVALAYAGQLDGLVIQHNPTDGAFWLFQSFCWVMAAAPGIVICERFLAHQEVLLEAERESVRQLAEQVEVSAAAYRELATEVAERVRLEHEVLDVRERERRDVGFELHDGLCQQLAGARLRSQVLERALASGAPPEPGQLLAIQGLLDEALAQAYALSRGLEPEELEPASLGPALRDLARKARQTHEVACAAQLAEPHGVATAEVATQLYHIAQESVRNALKHSGAKEIQVALACDADGVALEISDDGCGIDATARRLGMGLRILQFRAHSIGAELTIDSSPGGGAVVRCRVPAVAA